MRWLGGLTFTESTPITKQPRIKGIDTKKRVQAFGSRKNHILVLPDADFAMAQRSALHGDFCGGCGG